MLPFATESDADSNLTRRIYERQLAVAVLALIIRQLKAMRFCSLALFALGMRIAPDPRASDALWASTQVHR